MSQATRQSIMKRLLSTVLGLLCTHVCCVKGLQVEQNPSALSLQEGASSTLWCNFSTSVNNVQWFRQNSEGHLINLFYIPSGTKWNGNLNATKKERHSTLFISSSKTTDSATYFCAVDIGNNRKLIWGLGTSLAVKPNIENPDPAVYQLRSPESSNTSICLFTDFDSKTNVSQATGSSVFASNSTVLDMQSTHSKSYGALHWSDKADFGCQDTFSETFYPSSEFSCDVTSVEKSFETDMNLNFQNLSVIGFRILLLKVAGFNLLMTLRLWSS